MTWTFNPADLKTVDLRDTAPGDILCMVRAEYKCDLCLRLASEDSGSWIVYLTGTNAYEVWPLKETTKVSVLRIAEGKNLRLEIEEKNGTGSFREKAGQLYIADSGAYLVASAKDSHGFTDACFVSLQTWQANRLGNFDFKAPFSTWKLVDVSDPDNKKTLLSVGDWNDAQVIQP